MGGECGSNSSQGDLHFLCERVRATKHAPRDPFHVFDRCHCLAEIVERGAGVLAERYSVTPPRPERGVITMARPRG